MKALDSPFDEFPSRAQRGVPKRLAGAAADAHLDPDGRHWPKLLTAPTDPVGKLEKTIRELSTELVERCIQIADLSNLRQQEASELHGARDEIESLGKCVAEFQDIITQHETKAAAAQQQLTLSDKVNSTLREQIDKTTAEAAELLQKLLKAETAFNDREVDIVAAQERVESLTAELAAKTAETTSSATALEQATRQHRRELDRQTAQFEHRIKKLEAEIAARNIQAQAREQSIEQARALFARRCDSLASTGEILVATQKLSQEKIESQADLIRVLEVLLRGERKSAEIKVREMTAELQRERLQRSDAERVSAAIRKDIVLLLPKLEAQRSKLQAPEPDASVSHSHAA